MKANFQRIGPPGAFMKRATVNILLFIIFPGLHLEISHPGLPTIRRNLKLDTSHMPVQGFVLQGTSCFSGSTSGSCRSIGHQIPGGLSGKTFNGEAGAPA